MATAAVASLWAAKLPAPVALPTPNELPANVITTKEQNRIIRAPLDQNLCINTCPGAGKTTTLIMRVVYISKYYNVPLSEICMLTFNRFLARDMINKFRIYGI